MTDKKRADFDAIDTNHDGFITAKEFREALQTPSGQISEANANAFVKLADKNGDDKISFEEYDAITR
ncbi:EF-hand domain-containing protein [Kitasatospora sp. NPDC048540]|uniref:EF-hand domain-containing protein n=1 Tax=unclassified Kitasatospora TaxID=2633591 RepID=UPI00053A8846|nr:EF-hand domain-containing protein [Kitasatospora sp. MBT63]